MGKQERWNEITSQNIEQLGKLANQNRDDLEKITKVINDRHDSISSIFKKMSIANTEETKVLQRMDSTLSALIAEYSFAVGMLTQVSPHEIVGRITTQAAELNRKKGL